MSSMSILLYFEYLQQRRGEGEGEGAAAEGGIAEESASGSDSEDSDDVRRALILLIHTFIYMLNLLCLT